MRRFSLMVSALALAGCVTTTEAPPEETPQIDSVASRNFQLVVAQVEPVAEALCRERINKVKGGNCDFLIQIDPRADQPANAYQSVDRSGRPVITFTQALIADAQNRHELAFVLGHEAAHHIRNHIPKKQGSAIAGALILGVLAAAGGAGSAGQDAAIRVGAAIGGQVFSKDMELEADELGTVITARAGFDPVKGAEYFARIPDPGNGVLSSHPPNAERQKIVRQTAAAL
ncbi:M48 family metalloprotease [Actibacterium sp. XHP0104]|uniref:M48 family metalloprotease n=1 Tax=Actibacterium sp. XHP0104 TaxID=2984335 RepID=UPI0021E7CFAB|nr:M48 family metalloprotease [Actibacterium sp. XHP0104]MCV2880469.1 M48 family metalloprotease [Actibacterium sp. XHP0104]